MGKPKTPKTVWTATITHRHGAVVYVCSSETKAHKKVYEYVKENWTEEITERRGGPVFPPPNMTRQEICDDYFDRMDCEESADIQQVCIE